jgi:diguanylate cyclase (GGDEF)-like protein
MGVLKEFLFDSVNLPSLPAVAIRILEAVKNEDTSFKELSGIISTDPALVAKTLKIVNSSFYGRNQKIDTLEKAIGLLGFINLKNIALSYVITKEFRDQDGTEFDFNLFWKRSVTASIAADMTGKLLNGKSDDAFVTGLLQDIGILIMFICNPDTYLRVLDEHLTTNLPIEDIEKNILGFDHQEIGSEVLKRWGFPENIYLPIKYHHEIKAFPNRYKRHIHTLLVSDKISKLYHGSNRKGEMDVVTEFLEETYDISREDIDNLIDAVAENSMEMLSNFEVNSEEIIPFSRLLQETNEELSKLNMTYAQLLINYKEEKERAEHLAGKLKEKNKKLREMARKDGLTNLFNHKYFHGVLDNELARSIRYKRPFSLIMFDIDYFKKINDTFGHRVGDIYLKKLSELVLTIVRENDIVARYGGEEFAVILPETDVEGGLILADRIRSAVEGMSVSAGPGTIQTTVSLGLSTYNPDGRGVLEREDLIDAADAAMYESKNSGRNRINVHDVAVKNYETALS